MAACEPVPQTLTLTGGQTGVDTVSRFLPAEGSLSLSNALDGQLTNAAYTGDLEKRVYLLSAPLWPGGVSGATRDVRTLELPLPTEAFATSSTVIAPDTAKWPGVRAYDIGLCSQQVPWNEFAQQLAEGVLAELKKRPDQVRSPSLTGVAEAFPILRGREGSEFDRVGFKMRFAASAIVGRGICTAFGCTTAGCRSPVVEVSFDMSLGTKPGANVQPTHDLDALAGALARVGAATTSDERRTLLADPAIQLLTSTEYYVTLRAFVPQCRAFATFGTPCDFQAPRSPAPSADELDALLGRPWCGHIAPDGSSSCSRKTTAMDRPPCLLTLTHRASLRERDSANRVVGALQWTATVQSVGISCRGPSLDALGALRAAGLAPAARGERWLQRFVPRGCRPRRQHGPRHGWRSARLRSRYRTAGLRSPRPRNLRWSRGLL